MAYGDDFGWGRYVPVAERRRQAARKVAALRKKGRVVDPVSIEGRTIARTFWGKAWCDHLESYSDYANRLPRGRRYARNGSVIDLQITPGHVAALVSGSSIYEVAIEIKPATKKRWRALSAQCAGKIDSVVELLQGTFSKGVMAILARRDTGLFPSPREIALECSCPDWATLCKHVAAALYGVGARLDHAPEMLFVLRDVDHSDLVAQAGSAALGEMSAPSTGQVLAADGLSDIFGIELEADAPSPREAAIAKPKRAGAKPRQSPTRLSSSNKQAATRTRRAKTKATPPVQGSSTPPSVVPLGNATVAEPRTPAHDAADKASTRARAGRAARRRGQSIAARELIALGVPRSTFQHWISAGVLVRTDERGIYLTTAATQPRIEKALQKQHR